MVDKGPQFSWSQWRTHHHYVPALKVTPIGIPDIRISVMDSLPSANERMVISRSIGLYWYPIHQLQSVTSSGTASTTTVASASRVVTSLLDGFRIVAQHSNQSLSRHAQPKQGQIYCFIAVTFHRHCQYPLARKQRLKGNPKRCKRE